MPDSTRGLGDAQLPLPPTEGESAAADHGEAAGRGDGGPGGVSRRELLIGGGSAVVGAAIGVGVTAGLMHGGTASTTSSAAVGLVAPPSALQSFTAAQARTLTAVLERLIPSDENGPGATEAKVWRYIDLSLAGELSGLLPTYVANLEDLDASAIKTARSPFAQLSASKQDEVLKSIEAGTGPGGKAGAAFFQLLRQHALQGMFGDPAHGGNANFVGWDLIGFPGPKLAVSPQEQQVGTQVVKVHKSTYDYPNFGVRPTGG
jgi:gluconate 2-dehydrogenase gamma chain